ncbi:4Fe-4S dicluster domain-containing protein [uncultured Oscillibacter sp.]|uniref:4Fe-4S dicluster domain-containing protein n=1 Tax=uncultured Oscillibacter sp. TaxID=876091 RepID=UPI00262966CC|nr:4Fe-4S dicluster domain-containing protein [uncultured Oscillibacter sp.]
MSNQTSTFSGCGKEDHFHYVISESCVSCGLCADRCPTGTISPGSGRYEIDPARCIDCGTCSAVCPAGAARPSAVLRDSISIPDINMEQCYFNPGCALSAYKPEVPQMMLELLQQHFGPVKPHHLCCRHDPQLEQGSTIINNCAGCDRRFRSLYQGIHTISFWEVIDSIDGLKLPDYSGLTVSVHDPCSYRHKPQVHQAVRSLLRKMNIEIAEAPFSGTTSICCGDNLYGSVPNQQVERRIRFRTEQFPCHDVAVYCIGCVRAMTSGGKQPRYLPDLLFRREAEPMPDTLDEYHDRVISYIEAH